jgi:glycosyltransferase involved in cell wall biosynthesis
MYVLNEVRRKFPKKRYVHINNGIDLTDFQGAKTLEELQKSYPAFNRKSYLFVGRLGQEKSVDILIRAVGEAVKKDPEIQLFLVGQGPSRESLLAMAEELGLGDNVHFLGQIPHSELLGSGLIHHARAFATASKSEIQSMTVLEAIGCGTPLVLADVDPMREIIDQNGLFFPPDDVGELARCLIQLAGDDELHQRFRVETARLAERYDGPTVAAQFSELYASLL